MTRLRLTNGDDDVSMQLIDLQPIIYIYIYIYIFRFTTMPEHHLLQNSHGKKIDHNGKSPPGGDRSKLCR